MPVNTSAPVVPMLLGSSAAERDLLSRQCCVSPRKRGALALVADGDKAEDLVLSARILPRQGNHLLYSVGPRTRASYGSDADSVRRSESPLLPAGGGRGRAARCGWCTSSKRACYPAWHRGERSKPHRVSDRIRR